MSRTAFGYVRLSQRGREGTLDEQRDAIREYTQSLEDAYLRTTRSDGKRTSGFDHADRAEYQSIKENVRAGDIDVVVTRDRARLSRDFDERLSLIQLFRATDAEWHVVEAGGKLGLDDPQTAAMECMHALMDYHKKKMEIERSREATQERIDKGFYHGSPPTGLQFDDDGEYLVPDPEEIDDVEGVIRLRAWGDSWHGIKRKTGMYRSTAKSVWERRELYADRAGIELPGEQK